MKHDPGVKHDQAPDPTLLARCRAVLGAAAERPVLERRGDARGHGAIVAHLLCVQADRDEVDALVRDLDSALTGTQRDHFLDRETATRTVCALPSVARDELLIDLLATRSTP